MRDGRIPSIERKEKYGIVIELIVIVIALRIGVVVSILVFFLEPLLVLSLLFFPLDLGVEIDLAEIAFIVGGLKIAAVDEVGQKGLDVRFVVVHRRQLEKTGKQGTGQSQRIADI